MNRCRSGRGSIVINTDINMEDSLLEREKGYVDCLLIKPSTEQKKDKKTTPTIAVGPQNK